MMSMSESLIDGGSSNGDSLNAESVTLAKLPYWASKEHPHLTEVQKKDLEGLIARDLEARELYLEMLRHSPPTIEQLRPLTVDEVLSLPPPRDEFECLSHASCIEQSMRVWAPLVGGTTREELIKIHRDPQHRQYVIGNYHIPGLNNEGWVGNGTPDDIYIPKVPSTYVLAPKPKPILPVPEEDTDEDDKHADQNHDHDNLSHQTLDKRTTKGRWRGSSSGGLWFSRPSIHALNYCDPSTTDLPSALCSETSENGVLPAVGLRPHHRDSSSSFSTRKSDTASLSQKEEVTSLASTRGSKELELSSDFADPDTAEISSLTKSEASDSANGQNPSEGSACPALDGAWDAPGLDMTASLGGRASESAAANGCLPPSTLEPDFVRGGLTDPIEDIECARNLLAYSQDDRLQTPQVRVAGHGPTTAGVAQALLLPVPEAQPRVHKFPFLVDFPSPMDLCGATASVPDLWTSEEVSAFVLPFDPREFREGRLSNRAASATSSLGSNANDSSLFPKQEEAFLSRPSIRITIPDHLKNLLVDDWENVTKMLQLVPLPSKAPANFIIDEYWNEEKLQRRLGTPEADVLEEFCTGLKTYFEKSLGKVLLYRFERGQLAECRKWWESSRFPDWEGKGPGDCYGAEHLARMLVNMPEMIAQTNMDAPSVARLKEELSKFCVWLSRNSTRFFVSKYTKPDAEYVEAAR